MLSRFWRTGDYLPTRQLDRVSEAPIPCHSIEISHCCRYQWLCTNVFIRLDFSIAKVATVESHFPRGCIQAEGAASKRKPILSSSYCICWLCAYISLLGALCT